MTTLGVDLAAEPKGTAMALIEWADDRARLVDLQVGVGDEAIVVAAARASKIGIDCAFGWPDDFVEFLQSHAGGERPTLPVDGGKAWRSQLAYRETDRITRERTGRWPLSVATDRLGVTALRCAGLLARLDRAGVDADRSGRGDIAEVYPAAALRLWGFDTRGYKRGGEPLTTLAQQLDATAPWLDLGEHLPLLIRSADAFDAVIASLISRAAALGHWVGPTPGEQLARARREGWIVIPDGSLDELADGLRSDNLDVN